MLFNLVPVGLSCRLLLVSLRSRIPYPGLLLGRLALAPVLPVGLAHCPGLRSVGHVLVPVVRPGELVHVGHNSLVNLKASNGSALVADGSVVPAGLDDDECADEVGDCGHGLESCAR